MCLPRAQRGHYSGDSGMKVVATKIALLVVLVAAASALLVRGFAAAPSEASLEHLRSHVLAIEEVSRPRGSGQLVFIDFEDLGRVRYSDEWSGYSAVKSLVVGESVDLWFAPDWAELDPVLRITSDSRGSVVSLAEMQQNIAAERWVDRIIGIWLLAITFVFCLLWMRQWRRRPPPWSGFG